MYFKYDKMICNTGGAFGSDFFFEKECSKRGIHVIVWSFHGHNTKSPCKRILTKEELMEGYEHVKIANKTLKRNIYNLSQYVKNLLSRNWYQVKNSQSIFAIGMIQDNMKIVNGGTGWAIQEGIDNKKIIFVFDQNKKCWCSYNYDKELFEDYDNIPILTNRFAGIGTREINDSGIKAIKDLFINYENFCRNEK